MRNYKKQKIQLILILTILLVLGIGIGYSALSEKLKFNSTISLSEINWDIGFTSVEDNGGTVLSESSILNDGKSITVLCDFGTNTKQQTCTTKATITNNSTFNISLSENPIITYNDTYIHTLTLKWNNHPTYENMTVLKDNFIAKGESEEVVLTIKSKFINNDNMPTEKLVIPVTITLNFSEYKESTLPTKDDLAILKSSSKDDKTAFRSDTYKTKIKTITIENEIDVPTSATESWDIGVNPGKVMAYVVPNETDSTYYDLYIQSDGQLYANKNMYYWFGSLTNVDSINGLNLLDTSNVEIMTLMFNQTGYNSTKFTLDVSNFDTSNVTNMSYMFFQAGYNSPELEVDVSKFDTSKVTDMSGMFDRFGYKSNSLTLDVSNFDTRKVTNMSNMFSNTGYSDPNFTLFPSNFDTSNVTNMSYMFHNTGVNSTVFNLNIDNFDTSKVTNMAGMFFKSGFSNPTFTIDVRNFNTKNVTDMNTMFYGTGYSNPTFTLDVSKFNTSNVTDMQSMFDLTGYNSTIFTLDVSNFNTSKVTNMRGMFSSTGYSSNSFTLDISNFDTSNVTDMEDMFYSTGYTNSNFTLNITNLDTRNVTNMKSMFHNTGYNSTIFTLDVSNFDTSKVTNMGYMLYATGYSNPTFTLDTSKFDTTNVTNTERMFEYTGYNSTKLNTSITIKNPNTTSYDKMFNLAATKPGSQITVYYTDVTSTLVDAMIATKSPESNVVKGVIAS